jgi:stage IV sporulation protein B
MEGAGMLYGKTWRRKYALFLAVCIAVMSAFYVRAIFIMPGEITLMEGENNIYKFHKPLLVNIKADRDGIIKLNNDDIEVSRSFFPFTRSVSLKSQKNGSVMLNMSLLGLIPLKTMKVDVVASRNVVACGNTVGVKLSIDGILVIGLSDVETLEGRKVIPMRDTGIKPGDIIIEANGRMLEDIQDLVDEIDESEGNPIKLKYKRGKLINTAEIQPVKSSDDNRYHIGLWVRDSTAGIGTLTFYDPETKGYGALGHGITDIDTGTLMPVEKGEILESSILGVKKGKQGIPGELRGVFVEDKGKLGLIVKNSDYGIYGILNEEATYRLSNRALPIGLRTQVKEGPAVILSNIDGNKVEEFNIEIQKVSRQNINSSKGMVIRITDGRLIETTGGIVQGMSGSPIIQDGRVVGAVTHVLVNDPTRGYGIFIEGMLRNIETNISGSQQKAG